MINALASHPNFPRNMIIACALAAALVGYFEVPA